jgi:hypothetical protein
MYVLSFDRESQEVDSPFCMGFFAMLMTWIAASASDELVAEIPEGENSRHPPSYTLLGDFIQTATTSLLAYRAEEPAEETTRSRPQAAD